MQTRPWLRVYRKDLAVWPEIRGDSGEWLEEWQCRCDCAIATKPRPLSKVSQFLLVCQLTSHILHQLYDGQQDHQQNDIDYGKHKSRFPYSIMSPASINEAEDCAHRNNILEMRAWCVPLSDPGSYFLLLWFSHVSYNAYSWRVYEIREAAVSGWKNGNADAILRLRMSQKPMWVRFLGFRRRP